MARVPFVRGHVSSVTSHKPSLHPLTSMPDGTSASYLISTSVIQPLKQTQLTRMQCLH